MNFIKKNIFMTVLFLVIAPLGFYTGYNEVYKPYGGDIASLFKMDNSDSKKTAQPTKAPIKEKKESNNIITNKKQEDDFPKITKMDLPSSVPEENSKNSKDSLGEKDGFENIDNYKKSDKLQVDDKTDMKAYPNISDIYTDISNKDKDSNIDLPEEKNNKKNQNNNISSDDKDKKSDNVIPSLTPSPSESLLDEKVDSEFNKELDKKTEDNPPVIGENIADDGDIFKMRNPLKEKEKRQTLNPTDNVLGEDTKLDGDTKDIAGKSQQNTLNILPKTNENVLGEDVKGDVDTKDILGKSQQNTLNILPKEDDNVLEEQSEKNDTAMMSPADKKSEAKKKELEKLLIPEDLFPISPSSKSQGIVPSPPNDIAMVQNKTSDKENIKTSTDNKDVQNDKASTQDTASAKDDVKNSADNKQSQTQESNINSQSIKPSIAECAYEHHIDSKAMKETFRLTISLKKNEQPLTMEVSRQLDLLNYVTMSTDDIDGYPDSFAQLSVFCKEMSVRKILTEGNSTPTLSPKKECSDISSSPQECPKIPLSPVVSSVPSP